MKKLRRSTKHKIVSGVCGGFAEYFNLDPVILRLAFVGMLIVSGVFPGLLIYLICVLVIPKESDEKVIHVDATPVEETPEQKS